MKPKAGDILIAEPYLGDTFFDRTVILLCEHSDSHSYGYVLNKPLEFKLNLKVEDYDLNQLKIGHGGPVSIDTLHFIHCRPDVLSANDPINKELFFGQNFKSAMQALAKGQINENDLRFFLGYSGWSAGQLEQELESNSWIIYKASSQNIMNQHSASFWNDLLKQKGGWDGLKANYPSDPHLN